MRAWRRALVVPLAALALWILPSDRPSDDVAAAARATTLADAAPVAVSSDEPVDSTTSTTGSTTSSTTQVESSSIASAADAGVATESQTSSSVVVDTTPETTTAVETTTSSTTTTIAPPTTEALSLGDQALERVAYPWREAFPEWVVVFRGPRNGIRALTFPEEQRVEIFVRSSDTAASLHRVFAHELGHIIDVELNSESDRQKWREQRNIADSAPWWPNAESPDFATGAGDFAEAFAVWETGVTTRSTLGNQPTADDLALLRQLSEG